PFDKLAANIDVGQMNIVGITGNDHAFEHLVWVFVNDLLVLECSRLRFISIADEVDWLVALSVHERPFQPAGKTGPASATKPREPDFFAELLRASSGLAVGQCFGGKRKRFPESFVATVTQVTIEVRCVTRLIGVF